MKSTRFHVKTSSTPRRVLGSTKIVTKCIQRTTIEFLPIHARYSPTLLFPILSERETNHQDCCGNSPDYIERVTTVPVVSHEEMTLENASQPNTPPYCQNCIRGFICLQHIACHVKHQRSAACQSPSISYLLSWRNKQKLLRTILSQLSENHISLKKI